MEIDRSLPEDIQAYLKQLDAFIESEIKPLEREHPQYFDHRRENARTDWDHDGQPRPAWEELLHEMRRRADRAGHLRFALPRDIGGQDGSNLAMAAIREYFASKGLGLHNDLQNESSVVGTFPKEKLIHRYGTAAQKEEWLERLITGKARMAFGLTEPDHGSDATWMETHARRDGDDWILNGAKRFNTGMHNAAADMIFARTSGKTGDGEGITAFIVPTNTPGLEVPFMWWTLNMPTDHAEVKLTNVRVPHSAIFGAEGQGLMLAQTFVHENRIRQAASSLGAAQFCVDESVKYARQRKSFGKALATHQAIQWPLVELHTECEMVRGLVRKTAAAIDDANDHLALSPLVSMANYRANRLVCEAADRAMQVHGGIGYSRHTPFEHIYRHHRRYRITEGSEEIQIRNVARHLFAFGSATGKGRVTTDAKVESK
ncbi:MAG: acyl-CoA dehydrogenase family protein [Janthinobacterium lividum]